MAIVHDKLSKLDSFEMGRVTKGLHWISKPKSLWLGEKPMMRLIWVRLRPEIITKLKLDAKH